MKDRNGCIDEFQELYKTLCRGQEDTLWQDRCRFGVAEESALQLFVPFVTAPIVLGSRYSFCPRSSSTEESSSLLSDHWKNIYFAARCLIETIVLVLRRSESDGTRGHNETTKRDDGTFQEYDAAAQQHILLIQQYVPDLLYYTIVQRTVDVLLLQKIPEGESFNATDTMDRRMQRICGRLGSPAFLYKVVQYNTSLCALRMQQVTQILLASPAHDDAMATSIRELDGRVVWTAPGATDAAPSPPTANHRGLFLYLLLQLTALRAEPSAPTPEWVGAPNHRAERGILHALMALLHQHQSTVHRIDFMVLLTVLYQKPAAATFRTSRTNDDRAVAEIQCLLSIESMALWYIFHPPTAATTHPSMSGDWIRSQHPFVRDLHLVNAGADRRELEDIVQWMRMMWKRDAPSTVPESFSLVVFSFGLLMCSVSSVTMSETVENETLSSGQVYWKTLHDAGMEFITQSNQQYNPMQYLCQIMSSHVASPAARTDIHAMLLDSVLSDAGYDDGNDSVPRLTNMAGNSNVPSELSSAALLYAYIGREILISTIHLFPSSLFLPTEEESTMSSLESIGLLASTMQAIFSNSPTLSQLFWSDWNSYLTEKENRICPQSRKETPREKTLADEVATSASVSLCRLLDVTQRLASSTLVPQEPTFPRHVGQREDPVLRLMKLVPILQIVSAVVYHPKMMENLFSEAIVPPSLISTILNLVSTPRAFSTWTESALDDFRTKFVVSLSLLSNIGRKSAECQGLLRRALEGTDCRRVANSLESTWGCVSNLMNIMTMSHHGVADGEAMAFHIWNILANIVQGGDDAPTEWILAVTQVFQVLQDPKYHELWHRWFLVPSTGATYNAPSASVLRVLDGLVGQLSNIAFSRDDCCSDCNIDAVISAVGTTVLSFLSVLPVLSTSELPLSRSADEDSEATSLHLTAISALIMNSVSLVLQHLLPIATFHSSDAIKSAAIRTYNDVIYALSSKGGVRESVAQHVINPVLLKLFEFIDASGESKDHRDGTSLDENEHIFPTRPSTGNLPEYFAVLLDRHLSHSLQPDLMNNRAEESRNGAEGVMTADCRFVTSLTAIRLLNIWSDSVDGGNTKSNEGTSPSYLLGIVASAPTTCARAHPLFTLPSRANQLMVWSLLLRQLITSRRGCTVDSIFVIKAFKCLSAKAAYFRETSTDETRSVWWYRDMVYSTVFASAMATYWKRGNAFLDQKTAEMLEFDVIRHFLSFFEAVADATPFAAISVLTKGGSSMIPSILETTAEVAFSLSNETESSKLGNSFFVFKVELVTSFLRILSSLRCGDKGTTANSQYHEFKNIVEHDKLLFRSLSSCVFSFAQVATTFSKEIHVDGCRIYNIFLRFVAAACRFPCAAVCALITDTQHYSFFRISKSTFA
jgi:hypothetical protein